MKNSELDVELSKREYSVGTRGLRPDLVGTPEQVAEKIRAYQDAGLTLLLIQCPPGTKSSNASPSRCFRWSPPVSTC
ncbi:LLM class flavin-dependent oxidoreductase [Rhodococcus oxybenzonivorans]|uniref:LLM class flavin-dependent oxidoreductase n=1 Tax=Rhodococcus oxybenzonivorans TaxID=1990687 RepID=UPI001E32AE2F|nr:LLM class flavin-dependent oxidoreductase [Rhodococcus oxybenzonivorans]